jgi:hypothetical protein
MLEKAAVHKARLSIRRWELHPRSLTRDWPVLYQFCRASNAQEAAEQETARRGIFRGCSLSPN